MNERAIQQMGERMQMEESSRMAGVGAGRLTVTHDVQAFGHVGVAVVTANIVHPPAVDLASILDPGVPISQGALGWIQLQILRGRRKGELAHTDCVRTSKVIYASFAVRNACVPWRVTSRKWKHQRHGESKRKRSRAACA